MEIWKSVQGFEGLYSISNKGRVLGPKGKILKMWISEYKYASLYINKVRTVKRVSRLVADAFIPNTENKPEVNHLDGDKLNDKASNLEWATRSENQIHAVRKGLAKKLKGALNKNSRPVHQFDRKNRLIKTWPGVKAAGRGGYRASCISSVCNGKLKTHAGYIWKFKED